jgi:ABC-2 type transport system permease protein
MCRILLLESKLLIRGRGVAIGVAALLIAGVCALGHGRTVIDRQHEALAETPRLQQEEHRRILGPLDPAANAGDQLYYLAFHTVREPSAWAPLAVGQRDVHAFNLKVRILALHGQLYDTDLGNPLLATLGQFDLAFVLVVLAPLLVIAFTFGAYSDEVTDGTWTLVRSQPTNPRAALAIRYLLRTAAVWLALLGLYGLATLWLGLPLDATWWLIALATAGYVALWTAASMVVAAFRRSSDFNLLALLGLWVLWTALGPALAHVAAAARYPLPEALELTVLQRQGYHAAWDEPLSAVMDAFYQRYPEWRATDVPKDRYSNGWYYAMQQRGDDAAGEAAARYRQALEARDGWVDGVSWFFPPAAFHRLLTRAAGTDLQGYLAYLDSVAAYHESLKRHFFPVVFSNATVAAVDWSAAPVHSHRD